MQFRRRAEQFRRNGWHAHITLWKRKKRKLLRESFDLQKKFAGMSFSPRKRYIRPSPGLMDIHHRVVSITLQSTDVYLCSLLVYFCHQEAKIFRVDILAKISLIWSTKIIAEGMHGIANWTRKALMPSSRQGLKAKSNKPISSGGEMRSK